MGMTTPREPDNRLGAFRKLGKWLRRRNARLLLTLLTLIGLVAIIVGAWRANLTDDKWSDALWLEIAKAGVQVVAVGVVGGALAAIWRSISARRERESERSDQIRAELVSLVALYNGVKAVRRILRSLGLDLKTGAGGETARHTTLLTEEQARGFHAQMLILNRLQLDFEAKIRQFGQTDFLDKDTKKVVERLSHIENYLNQVLKLWEQSGWTIQEGTALDVVSDGLVRLFRAEKFRPGVSDPMREITGLINEHVFGGARKETQTALERIDSEAQKRELDEKVVKQ
jgi:hypothetical protein